MPRCPNQTGRCGGFFDATATQGSRADIAGSTLARGRDVVSRRSIPSLPIQNGRCCFRSPGSEASGSSPGPGVSNAQECERLRIRWIESRQFARRALGARRNMVHFESRRNFPATSITAMQPFVADATKGCHALFMVPMRTRFFGIGGFPGTALRSADSLVRTNRCPATRGRGCPCPCPGHFTVPLHSRFSWIEGFRGTW